MDAFVQFVITNYNLTIILGVVLGFIFSTIVDLLGRYFWNKFWILSKFKKNLKKEINYNICLLERNVIILNELKTGIVEDQLHKWEASVSFGRSSSVIYEKIKQDPQIFEIISTDDMVVLDKFFEEFNMVVQRRFNSFIEKIKYNQDPQFRQGDIEHINETIKNIQQRIDEIKQIKI